MQAGLRENLGRMAALAWLVLGPVVASAEIQPADTGAFTTELNLVVAGDPETVFDACTCDVTGWWDHSFSEEPLRMYIEAKPGGGFYEIFDEQGNGVRHAEVIFSHRGKRISFEGPLGFNGHALQLVTTWEFTAQGDSTRILVKVSADGVVQEGWPEAIDGVWKHFMVEQFKPWYEGQRAESR